jgi:predicted glycosyltransferase
VDAQSLIALADVAISAGGTMNREAVALDTPVWTTFEGRLGAPPERLIAAGRLHRLERAEDLVLTKRTGVPAERVRRVPLKLVELLCTPVTPASADVEGAARTASAG